MGIRLLYGLLALIAAMMLGATAGSAQDREGGLQVDPGSPSGREYAIPLEQARRNGSAAGPADRITPGQRNVAPAFGEGVGDGGGSSASGSTDGGATSKDRAQAGSDRPARDSTSTGDDASRRAPAVASIQRSSADTGSGPVIAIAGVGGGVLLMGAAAGVVLRRRITR